MQSCSTVGTMSPARAPLVGEGVSNFAAEAAPALLRDDPGHAHKLLLDLDPSRMLSVEEATALAHCIVWQTDGNARARTKLSQDGYGQGRGGMGGMGWALAFKKDVLKLNTYLITKPFQKGTRLHGSVTSLFRGNLDGRCHTYHGNTCQRD